MQKPNASLPHGQPGHDGHSCSHCLVDPKRNKSSLVAWIVAGVAVAFALAVYFTKAGSFGNNLAGGGSIALLAILVCPLMMGVMMFFMMRKSH
ncbi:MAG: hypothetical protein WC876_03680 [Candidatus Thermoplasmatota archaeon]